MKIQYLEHDLSGNLYRVKRDDWPDDMFDLVGVPELEQIKNVCKRFGIVIEEIIS